MGGPVSAVPVLLANHSLGGELPAYTGNVPLDDPPVLV